MSRPVHDPRSEAEKARADLKRNTEMGTAVPESPLEHQPSVTPDSFGVHDEAARARSGATQGVEAGGRSPGAPERSESIVEGPQVAVGRDSTREVREARRSGPKTKKKD